MNTSHADLKTLRKNNGKSAAEVADELKIARSTYSNYEQGIRTIPLNTVIPLAKILSVTAEEIIEAQLISISLRSTE